MLSPTPPLSPQLLSLRHPPSLPFQSKIPLMLPTLSLPSLLLTTPRFCPPPRRSPPPPPPRHRCSRPHSPSPLPLRQTPPPHSHSCPPPPPPLPTPFTPWPRQSAHIHPQTPLSLQRFHPVSQSFRTKCPSILCPCRPNRSPQETLMPAIKAQQHLFILICFL